MLNWLFYILTALLGLGFFTSKSAIAISGWLLLITSPLVIGRRELKALPLWLISVLALYPLAILFNLLSLGGIKSAAHTASSLPFILFTLIFYALWKNSNAKRIFFVTSLASVLVACGYSFFLLFTEYQGVFTGQERVASFFDVSRWGLFSAIASLALYIGCFHPMSKRVRIICTIGLIITLASFTISSSRAPMLGLFLSLFFLGVVVHRKFLSGLLILTIAASIALMLSPGLLHRVESITEIHTSKDGRLTSSDTSNAGRLYMWKIASDFWKEQPLFGTGMENTKEPLKNFLARQTDEYRQKYVIHNFSYNDQHSSYLNILVQFGLIYFIIFFSVIGWVLYKAWDLQKIKKSPERQFAWAGVICFLTVGIFYGEIISFGSIMFWPLIPLLFYEEQLVQKTNFYT